MRVGREHRLLSAAILGSLAAALFLPPSTPSAVPLAALFLLLATMVRFASLMEEAVGDQAETQVVALLQERTELGAAEAERLASDIRDIMLD